MTGHQDELDPARLEAIMRAAMQVFGAHEYKRAATEDIARLAGISKGLLFYYFRSKLELYKAALDYASQLITDYVLTCDFQQLTDFFEVLAYASARKVELMERYPHVFDFVARANFETIPEIAAKIAPPQGAHGPEVRARYLEHVNYEKFKPEVDPTEILNMLVWLAEGYLYTRRQAGLPICAADVGQQTARWIEWLRPQAYREEYL